MSDTSASAPVRPTSTLAWRRSVRFRLLAIALLPMVIVLPALLMLALTWWTRHSDQLLISRVNSDLTIARQYFNHIMDGAHEKLKALASSAAFERNMKLGTGPDMEAFLASRKAELGLNFLYLADANGIVIAASRITPPIENATRWPVVATAMDGKDSTAIDIFTAEDLQRLSPGLENQARVDLVPTPAAVPTDRRVETRGMVVHSATSVRLADGRPAALVGGMLLNQNLRFIDTINDLVYKPASLPDGSHGTATLFLDDVRVSTNVRLFGEKRALGTRVSRSVREAVLDNGREWLDRAFVVNDWYISGYEPILDSYGKRVGMLYVGFLERPFWIAKITMLAVIAFAFLLVTVLAVPLFLRWARGIFRPLEQMDQTMALVESGNLGARTGSIGSGDEIGRVAHHLDALLDALEVRDRELRSWAGELDRRVAERTAELEAANRHLEAAQQQLVMSEKLAAIGEITAGVAHEINNPIAVIQGNLDVAREVLGSATEPVKTEFALIDQQVNRINLIVTKLLQFARPDEYAGYVERVAPGVLVTDCLVLVQHLLGRAEITVAREEHGDRAVLANRIELQQVLINLFVNAIHAMPDGGTLTVRTEDHDVEDAPGLAIVVTDTGVGIPPEHMKKVFDAFFTSKPQRGTGLGLSISYTLVARYGGQMWVESEVGKGASFTVWLPAVGDGSDGMDT